QVCAPSRNALPLPLQCLDPKPGIVRMSPHPLQEIFGNTRELGRVTHRLDKAEAVIAERRARLEKISERTKNLSRRPQIFCMEWADPVYGAGHWVPEMIEI